MIKISQEEVLHVLAKKGELSAGEIVDIIHIGYSSVQKSLRCLLKQGEIKKLIKTKEEIEAKGKKFSGKHYSYIVAD